MPDEKCMPDEKSNAVNGAPFRTFASIFVIGTLYCLAGGFYMAYSLSKDIKKKLTRRRSVGIIPVEGNVSIMMIKEMWETTTRAKCLDCVVVATHDTRIAVSCVEYGVEVILTSNTCRNGIECCTEALQILKMKKKKNYGVVVCLQPSQLPINPEAVDHTVKSLQGAPDAVSSAAITVLQVEDQLDLNKVKCMVDNHGYAVYFSRELTPKKCENLIPGFRYLLHSGVQSYNAQFLEIYPSLPYKQLQEEENIDELRILQHGFKIKVVEV